MINSSSRQFVDLKTLLGLSLISFSFYFWLFEFEAFSGTNLDGSLSDSLERLTGETLPVAFDCGEATCWELNQWAIRSASDSNEAALVQGTGRVWKSIGRNSWSSPPSRPKNVETENRFDRAIKWFNLNRKSLYPIKRFCFPICLHKVNTITFALFCLLRLAGMFVYRNHSQPALEIHKCAGIKESSFASFISNFISNSS